MEILNIKNLSFKYPNSENNSLTDINLTVNEGEFVVVFGESGSGKTTLLRLLKKEIAPYGEKQGDIKFKNKNIEKLTQLESAKNIGFVMQNPKSQIVTNKVSFELAFGLENIGEELNSIRRKVAETADFFGISNLFNKDTSTISGGQTQLLNLASIMAMQPNILLLDEPLSQLDPISSKELITVLKRLNEELSITIVIVEHRLEELLPIADKAVYIKDGKIKAVASPKEVCKEISSKEEYSKMLKALPVGVQIYNKFKIDTTCPMSVKQTRKYIKENFKNVIQELNSNSSVENKKNIIDNVIEVRNVFFRYEKKSRDILTDVTLDIKKEEVLSILGANGSGKTTLLKLLCKDNKPYSGKIKVDSKTKILLLPQNPIDLLVKDSVIEDLEFACENYNSEKNSIENICKKLGVEHTINKNPMDLSGGEQQKVAIAKLLIAKPDVLLMDEPTKGMDAYARETLVNIIKDIKKQGVTVIVVTHDTDFCAKVSDRCLMLFNGEVVAIDSVNKFFSDNIFYQTSVGKITKNIYKNINNIDSLEKICKINGRLKEV